MAQPKGEKHSSAKLTEKLVIEIREEYAKGLTSQIDLAYSFDITPRHAGKILNREVWKHI